MKARKTTTHSAILMNKCLGVLVLLCVLLAYSGLSAQVVTNAKGTEEQITIVVGQSHVVKAPWPTVRVAVTDPKIADVQILTPSQVLLQGLKVGSTDLILWSEDETKIWQLSVHVTLDIAVHEQKLLELFPRCQLDLSQSGDVLIVKGLLRSSDQAAHLRDYLEKTQIKYVDMTSLAGIQQVQLQIRVAEVSRSAVRALGINAMWRDNDYFAATRPGSSSGGALVPSAGFVPFGGQSALSPLGFGTVEDFTLPSSLTAMVGIPRADLEIFIQALAENQYLRILANPTLVALSGEEASFLAGGEFPIPVVQSSSGATAGGTSITIEYKEFGVRLKFRPTVLGDGTIRLYTAPEVSELTSVGAVTIQGFEVPALTTRKAETTIELKSGQTFAMAGLMRSKVNAITSRLPGIGDLPIIGPLFRSTRYANDETEMVVLVTAVLVEPMSMAQVPPLPGFLHKQPNDWEFYIEGRIEGKEPARINSADADWLRQMGLDKLMGPGAWDYYGNSSAPSQADMTPEAENSSQENVSQPAIQE
ncbi:MAG: type II and III secretion system protein family protein [Planctomycetota bacterium]